ncbi:MAG: glutamyl-tRNA reductase [Verrucomicrobia bacterium]|jgi:glutamyl-tRNA reductase|nr:glutamyl-tRNA reductase [Verrucomicrobiota bacterium]
MLPEDTRLVVLGCNHQRTPLEVREKMALGVDAVGHLQRRLRDHEGIREGLVLNTCNRIELYALTSEGDWQGALAGFLEEQNHFPSGSFLEYAYAFEGEEAVAHAFAVASGLDSQMVGETQILGQMKDAYGDSVQAGNVGSVFHRLFQKAFQAAKWARSETGITSGQVSLGNVAVELATRIFGRLKVSRTLVVGSGDVGREVARAFRSRGVACISIASRTPERAESLSREIDGLVIPFSTWEESLPYIDIAIFATSAPEVILTEEKLRNALGKRPQRPIFLIDLAVPRDIDAAINRMGTCYLYNLEDLAAIANENLASRQQEVDACRASLRERAQRLWRQLAG